MLSPLSKSVESVKWNETLWGWVPGCHFTAAVKGFEFNKSALGCVNKRAVVTSKLFLKWFFPLCESLALCPGIFIAGGRKRRRLNWPEKRRQADLIFSFAFTHRTHSNPNWSYRTHPCLQEKLLSITLCRCNSFFQLLPIIFKFLWLRSYGLICLNKPNVKWFQRSLSSILWVHSFNTDPIKRENFTITSEQGASLGCVHVKLSHWSLLLQSWKCGFSFLLWLDCLMKK